jgi:hypothetical protein
MVENIDWIFAGSFADGSMIMRSIRSIFYHFDPACRQATGEILIPQKVKIPHP